MTVKNIYTNYQIPPNLQKHQLRVASLSQILGENWKGEKLDVDAIALCGLFHDMANIIKYNFDKPQLFKEEGKRVDYWRQIQKEYLKKYGTNIHKATLTICQEIGLSKKVLQLIENLEWDNTLKVLKENNFSSAIMIYCDMRIGPFGILPLKERMKNLKTRVVTHDMEKMERAGKLLEKTLQENIKININAIKDSQINSRFKELLGREV